MFFRLIQVRRTRIAKNAEHHPAAEQNRIGFRVDLAGSQHTGRRPIQRATPVLRIKLTEIERQSQPVVPESAGGVDDPARGIDPITLHAAGNETPGAQKRAENEQPSFHHSVSFRSVLLKTQIPGKKPDSLRACLQARSGPGRNATSSASEPESGSSASLRGAASAPLWPALPDRSRNAATGFRPDP